MDEAQGIQACVGAAIEGAVLELCEHGALCGVTSDQQHVWFAAVAQSNKNISHVWGGGALTLWYTWCVVQQPELKSQLGKRGSGAICDKP